MKKQEQIYRPLIVLAVTTAILLSIPFVAMQFTTGVSWSITDFIIMAALILGTGLSYILLSRTTANFMNRLGIGLMVVTAFLMIWANLAVGLIGSGSNAGNLMYIGVLLVLVTGILLSHLRPAAMERAAYATVLALVLHTVIALLANMQHYSGSSVEAILCVNGFFIALFTVSGILFHFAARQTLPKRV